MVGNVQIFSNEEFGTVRTIEINGEIYFVGKDVATILGYQRTADAIAAHVDAEDKLTRQFTDSGQAREMTMINESGLYSLIMSSKLPKAKEFKRWVTSEVLPSIRKHGAYMTGATIDKIISEPEFGIKLLKALQQEREEKAHLQELVSIQSVQIEEMKPKVSYYDLILQSKEAIPVSLIAKDYGMSGKAMNQLLNDLKIQYRCGGTWLVYQEYAAKGYTITKTFQIEEEFSKTHTYWTQKGRLFLYETLKQNGNLPLIEQTEK